MRTKQEILDNDLSDLKVGDSAYFILSPSAPFIVKDYMINNKGKMKSADQHPVVFRSKQHYLEYLAVAVFPKELACLNLVKEHDPRDDIEVGELLLVSNVNDFSSGSNARLLSFSRKAEGVGVHCFGFDTEIHYAYYKRIQIKE